MLTPWKESYDQPRQHIKKQGHYFANKSPSSQGYGFSSGHVWMWELDCEESWVPKKLLLLNMLSRLVITFLPRSKRLLILWLQSPSAAMWSTGEGNGKPLQYSCLENPMTVRKGKMIGYWKRNSPVGRCPICYWRSVEKLLHKEWRMDPKQKQYPVVDVTGDGSKVRCCKEQYCIGTWNVRSMNQGKLEVVKQEMARVNVNILGISELKWNWNGWI